MLTVIVLSSDGYSDCWIPFFKLLKRNFPNIENFEIILSTNLKKFEYPDLKIRCITHGLNVLWTKRLRLSIEEAKNDTIFLLTEDDFLKTPINGKVFSNFLNLMNEINDIDHIRFRNAPLTKTKDSDFDLLDKIDLFANKRFTFQPGLWKKKILVKYLRDRENPFMAELMADSRSKIYKDGFYCISKDYVKKHGYLYDGYYSGVIYKGKWSHWAIDFLKVQNFNIDFSVRGIIYEDDMKGIRFKARIAQFKNPILILKYYLYKIYVKLLKYKYEL